MTHNPLLQFEVPEVLATIRDLPNTSQDLRDALAYCVISLDTIVTILEGMVDGQNKVDIVKANLERYSKIR